MLAQYTIRKHAFSIGVRLLLMTIPGFVLVPIASGKQQQKALHFGLDRDRFYTLGRWVPADPRDRPAYPSETEIDCDKATMICTEATAEYFSGHPHIELSYATVTKWDQNSLIAVDNSGICMEKTLLVSFPSKTLLANFTMKQLDEKKKGACKFLGVEKPEAAVFVIKGSKEWTDDLPN